MCLGLSVFLVFEALCRLAGWGIESSAAGDFSEFNAARPLFRISDDQQTWQVAANRRRYFAKESFPAIKGQHEFRIFVFGGSTVQGRPFSIPTSFTTFLKIALRQANPKIDWQVVNCGGISYASYRVLPIVRECLRYKPDLYIVCTGHNEFLECVSYNNIKSPNSTLATCFSALNKLQSFHLAEQTWEHFRARPATVVPAPSMPEEVEAMLDHQGGLDAYRRSALHADHVNIEFGCNLQKMISAAGAGNVPIMFISPPSNLRDCPPFKSEFHSSTNLHTQQAVTGKIKNASNSMSLDPPTAIQLLQSAVQDDPEFAFAWYQLGHALLALNRDHEAANAFAQARDKDVCPLRMTSQLKTTLQAVARENNIKLLDADALLLDKARNGIIGDAVLVDHVHPSFKSHQNIAIAVIDAMASTQWIQIKNTGWKDAARSDFDNHLQSLDNMYFLSGRRTLDTLRLWTQGRGDGPVLDSFRQ